MYYFIGYKIRNIDGHKWLRIFILSIEDVSITSYFVPYSDDTFEFINSFDRFQDVSNLVRFRVRSDGKVSLYLENC